MTATALFDAKTGYSQFQFFQDYENRNHVKVSRYF